MNRPSPTPLPARGRRARSSHTVLGATASALAPAGLRRTALALSLLGAAAAMLLLPAPAQAAGAVTVNFVEPENFRDAGTWHVDRDSNLKELQRHLEQLGQRLPEGQTLAIEVLDVDLAGEVWPRVGSEVRIVRGRIDWPQIQLRYTLSEGGRTLASGEENVADPSYLFGGRPVHTLGALPYEKRMLTNWFRARFEAQTAAAAR